MREQVHGEPPTGHGSRAPHPPAKRHPRPCVSSAHRGASRVPQEVADALAGRVASDKSTTG